MIFAILYILICLVMLGAAFTLIFKNISDINKLDISRVNYNITEKKRYVTRQQHPEMEEVEVGDELLVVRFDEPKKEQDPRFKLDSPELHNLGDPLHKSLKERIEELEEDGTD